MNKKWFVRLFNQIYIEYVTTIRNIRMTIFISLPLKTERTLVCQFIDIHEHYYIMCRKTDLSLFNNIFIMQNYIQSLCKHTANCLTNLGPHPGIITTDNWRLYGSKSGSLSLSSPVKIYPNRCVQVKSTFVDADC